MQSSEILIYFYPVDMEKQKFHPKTFYFASCYRELTSHANELSLSLDLFRACSAPRRHSMSTEEKN